LCAPASLNAIQGNPPSLELAVASDERGGRSARPG
jgi:hypothetical protein